MGQNAFVGSADTPYILESFKDLEIDRSHEKFPEFSSEDQLTGLVHMSGHGSKSYLGNSITLAPKRHRHP